MAVLQCIAKEVVSGDQAVDAQKYKQGDVLKVYPDTVEFKSKISDKWFFVRVPDLSVKEAQKYLEPLISDTEEGRIIKKRKYRLKVNEFPTAIKDQITATRVVETNKTTITPYISLEPK